MEAGDNGQTGDPRPPVPDPRWSGERDLVVDTDREWERSLAAISALFADAPVGLGLFDHNLRYLRVNPVLSGIIGLPSDALLGRTIAEAMPGFGDMVIVHMRKVLETGKPVRNLELWGRTLSDPSQHHERCYLVSYFRLANPAGEILGIVSLVVDDTERRRSAEAIALANQRLTLLSRAGEVLGSSLDFHQTLVQLAELAVPSFADHCIVDLADGTERFHRVALVHTDAVRDGIGAEGWASSGTVVYPSAHPVRQVASTGRPQRVDDVSDEYVNRVALSPASAAFTRKLRLKSLLVVPLLAQNDVLGVICFALSVTGRRYTDADLDLATEIAGRAAVALDHARSYQRERTVAITLQRSLLPKQLPVTEGLISEWRYLPGGTDAAVGGDWFDLIPLSTGRTGLVIGDVMGRGVQAAALPMGQLRAATRSSAALDLPPAVLLRHLDDLVAGLDSVQLVTCVYGVYEPSRHCVTLANAGHLWPLLVDPTGCRPVVLDNGVPLGVGSGRYRDHEIALPPGSTLVLYTDGLVERRGIDIDASIAALCNALASSTPGSSLCETAVSAMIDGAGHNDDVAVLTLRSLDHAHAQAGIDVDLAPTALAPRQARAQTAAMLKTWGFTDRLDVALLLVSEVVTNAVRHAGTELRLHLRPSGDLLYIEVADGDTRVPRLSDRRPDDEGGRGLHLVDAFASRWGVRPTAQGKVVWLELAATSPQVV